MKINTTVSFERNQLHFHCEIHHKLCEIIHNLIKTLVSMFHVEQSGKRGLNVPHGTMASYNLHYRQLMGGEFTTEIGRFLSDNAVHSPISIHF